ncbi:MAG: hypothetical protein ABWY06_00760 [Pseudomonas sp.]|uniref:hypothetical protein n=1 Tax=Pseudomonas sp. TaxID=306 RepID=UPI003399BD65
MAFHLAYRNYLAQAADLDARERERQAGRLAEQIDAYEARDELALSEALLLQVALIRASGADAATQQKRADALSARYRGLSVARQAPQTSPQFERYKVEEQQIVAEVLGLTLLPPGLSRDQYLRQRLQAAREAAYAADPGNAR